MDSKYRRLWVLQKLPGELLRDPIPRALQQASEPIEIWTGYELLLFHTRGATNLTLHRKKINCFALPPSRFLRSRDVRATSLALPPSACPN
jgi:hypothetical protein